MPDLAFPASDKAGAGAPSAPAWRVFAPAGLLALVIAAAMVGQVWYALSRQINWDEFYFLSRIHEYARGDMQDALQTFHVHLFRWLMLAPGHEVDRIVAARFVMLVLEAGTLTMIFLIAKRFTSTLAALFAVAAYVTSSNVIVHGASFRFDPVATLPLMSALALLLLSRLRWYQAAAAGALIAIAGLITIKSIFYLPIVVAVALWRLAGGGAERRATFLALAVGGLASGLVFLGLHLFHAAAMKGRSSTSGAQAFLSHSMSTMLNLGELWTKWVFLAQSAMQNVVLWAGILVGIGIGVRRLRRGSARRDACVMLAFAFPLLTLLFYRNSFPYYYVFALAPAALFVAVAIDALNWSIDRIQRVTAMLVVFASAHFYNMYTDQAAQRSTIAAVHDLFSPPVPYIDQYSMVGSFPKVGFFMSTWGMETYLRSQTPSFPKLIASEQPVFVLANSFVLINAMEGTVFEDAYPLLPRDVAALRDNYIHHWGAIWIAGKTFDWLTPVPQALEIAVSGDYTVEARGDVMVDGRRLTPGAVVNLAPGRHEIRTADGFFPVTLRWGDHLPVPANPAPEKAIFNGF